MFRPEELSIAIGELEEAIKSLELSGANCSKGILGHLKAFRDEMQEELDEHEARVEAERAERYERERREMIAEYWAMVK